MNREMKRMMQRQGLVGPDGTPATAPSRPSRKPRTTPKKNSSAPLERRNPLTFFREVMAELRKVTRPTTEEIRNYSLVVMITLAILIALIFGLDWAFTASGTEIFK